MKKGTKINRPLKPFCKYGHEIAIVGRDKSGACNACIADRSAKRNKAIQDGFQIMHKKQFCVHGHDTLLCGRDKYGACKDCEQINREPNKEKHIEYAKQWYLEHKDEIALKSKQYYIDNKAAILSYQEQYRIDNPEKLAESKRQYAKDHPEVQRKSTAKIRVKRKSSLVSFGQDGIDEFYDNMPKGMSGDHIIPIVNDYVQGLHVIWNLQYLTRSQNSSKQNKIDLMWASEWYGKLLEEVGLKVKVL